MSSASFAFGANASAFVPLALALGVTAIVAVLHWIFSVMRHDRGS
jgi:hypothetical protein